eukprot:Protomagalhaensia_wolfi_Nauph_80__3201@NODE_3262_length_843_cov_15_486318_g2554_i0_p1_GENE_NODE_3262_length_843_cov_15_486318_g2554_i0NODE_3262_length_843_cov_15_486318_g2554_i0_p1_ORF_typecomplete_len248_score28_44DUF1931/PF09123_11/0_2_NODE_3262_length_843_cov_15_486318_g2554_i020763
MHPRPHMQPPAPHRPPGPRPNRTLVSEQLVAERAQWAAAFQRERPDAIGIPPQLIIKMLKDLQRMETTVLIQRETEDETQPNTEHPEGVSTKEEVPEQTESDPRPEVAGDEGPLQPSDSRNDFVRRTSGITFSPEIVEILCSFVNENLVAMLTKGRDNAIMRRSSLIEMRDLRLGVANNKLISNVLCGIASKSDFGFGGGNPLITSSFDPVKLPPPDPDTPAGDWATCVMNVYAMELAALNEVFSNL